MSDRDTLFSAPIARLGDWTFDERVAEVFRALAAKSPLRGSLSLSLPASGRARGNVPVKPRPQPTSMWADPAYRERFGDLDATKKRAVF